MINSLSTSGLAGHWDAAATISFICFGSRTRSAVLRACTAAGQAGHRLFEQRIAGAVSASGGRLSAGPEGSRLCRGPERPDRISVGRGPIRRSARDGDRSHPPRGECHCRVVDSCSHGGRSFKDHNPDHFRYGGRSGQARFGGKLEPPGPGHHRRVPIGFGVGGEAAGIAARFAARGHDNRVSCKSCRSTSERTSEGHAGSGERSWIANPCVACQHGERVWRRVREIGRVAGGCSRRRNRRAVQQPYRAAGRTRGTTAHTRDLSSARVRRGWRPDELWGEPSSMHIAKSAFM